MLGIQEVIDELRDIHGSALEDHFDLFEMMKQEDEQEEFQSISDSGASSPSIPDSPTEMAEEIEKKLATSSAFPHYVSLLRHLLLIPRNEKSNEIWKLFVIILQQISLQISMKEFETSMDPGFDEAPAKFSMDSVISKLKTHLEFEKIEKEMEKMQKELNFERKKNLELENRIADLQETDGFSINSFLRGGSDTSSNPSDPCPSSPLPSTSTISSGIPECRPPIQMPPPPPPPSIKDLKSFGGFSTVPKKNYYPKPPNSMKALNWKVLPATKIKGTIFEKAEDEKMLKLIDLGAVAEQFTSGKDHDDKASTSGTLRRRGQDCHSMSILEPRRAQNCTIMLSKLKLSHREIRQAVLTMDETGKIPKDMIEQMLKYIPTSDELVQIEEIVERLKSPSVLALADRYFYEIGKIPRFEQRLRCLNAIRSFQERTEIITSYANGK
uniref:FH2 domain-containing protein n=1 Tax=Panagrolaimus superbus TaxID=310955 RepID=A0A914YWX8_9BILA